MFYQDLFNALERHQVKYVLVGGLAIMLHGIQRLTMDVDLMLSFDPENLERFFIVAQELELKPVAPVALRDLANQQKIDNWIKEKHMIAFALRSPRNETPTLDILVQSKVPFEQVYARRIQKDVEPIKINLASIPDLIELKKVANRLQDKSDIEALERVLKWQKS